jgi:hypothetical protein
MITQQNLHNATEYESFRTESLKILKEVSRIMTKIYDEEEAKYALLTFLSMILEETKMIDFTARLLEDEDLHSIFDVCTRNIENIVLYMYKWSFTKSIKYVENAQYLKKLLELLPADN